MSAPILLFLGTESDKNYTPRLKPMVGASTVYTLFNPVSTVAEVILYCKKRNITGVLTTNTTLLSKLLSALGNPKASPSLDKYAGSYILHQDIEFVFLNPLEQLLTVPYGSFITKRFVSKLAEPSSWKIAPQFNWSVLDESNEAEIFNRYKTAIAIAVDIETVKENLAITNVGYTAIFSDSSTNTISTHSCVLCLNSGYALSIVRKFNWQLQAPKILQNGKYDNSYLLRYNAPVYNYLWDTATMFHSWYSELPKDLAFLSSFFIKKSMYWKDLAKTTDAYEYMRYNALDTYGTALVFIEWMLQAPAWARRNYLQEFPLVYPCMLSEGTGIKRDMKQLEISRKSFEAIIEIDNISLSKMVGTYPQIFNVNSTPQTKALRTLLGCKDMESSDEKHLKKMALRHPLNSRIVNKILDLRGNRKLVSTYLCEGKEINGRILYALNPHGTDTGRLASTEHHFWAGLQIQNIPRGREVKCTLIADEGFRLAECDLEQAESRDTGYISGDKNLIAAVESERDFHSVNASAFFGIPYELIYDDELGKVIDKILRDLAKRTNHGATYVMGAGVLLDTMGETKVWEAKRLLNLPRGFSLLDTTEYLLRQFHKTYPTLEKIFYPAIVNEVMTTRMLVSRSYHHTKSTINPDTNKFEYVVDSVRESDLVGWARYCFSNPQANKRDKNSYVAHAAQSLNAMTLNKAFMKVFYDIAINEKHKDNFKLCAQIHDSIFFQFREGHSYLCDMVRERMEIPVTIKGYDGTTRTFVVPAAIKAGKDKLGALNWADTE